MHNTAALESQKKIKLRFSKTLGLGFIIRDLLKDKGVTNKDFEIYEVYVFYKLTIFIKKNL